MTEMVEHVARALQKDDGSPCISSAPTLCRLTDGCVCRSLAIAAIGAMRDPTPNMLAAGWACVHRFWGKNQPNLGVGPGFKEAHRAMIDAALREDVK